MKSTDMSFSSPTLSRGVRLPDRARSAPASIAARADRLAVDSFERLARRIRNEYLEMPGLSLTLPQAERMWQLRHAECEHLLGTLVDSGFLARTSGGAFVRAGSGRAGA
jgi:hypothetical protein